MPDLVQKMGFLLPALDIEMISLVDSHNSALFCFFSESSLKRTGTVSFIITEKLLHFALITFKLTALLSKNWLYDGKSIKIDVAIKPFLELFSVAQACLCDSGLLVLVVLSQGFEIRLSSPVLIPPKTSGVT